MASGDTFMKLIIVLPFFVLCACDRAPVYVPAKWISVPAGTFTMGAAASENCREPYSIKETQHKVTFTRSFEISSTETTQGQFEDLMAYNPSCAATKKCGSDCPVDQTSWGEAAAYCNALSRTKGLAECYTCTGKEATTACESAAAYRGYAIYACPGYRLPTEAEWEYACRAGTTTALYSGNVTLCKGYDPNASKIAWFGANSGMTAHESGGEKVANKWEIHDMSGSVWEWTNDWYQADLGSTAVTDPAGPSAGLGRVLRGGSVEVAAELVRSASRHKYGPPKERLKFQGFRCVRTLGK